MKNKRIFLGLTGILVLAIVVAAFGLIKINPGATPQSYRDWNTYTVDKFTMQYPNGWNVQKVDLNLIPGLKNLVYVSTPNESNNPSAMDEPTRDSVIIEVLVKEPAVNPNIIVGDFRDELGFAIQETSYIVEEGKLNGYDATFIYKDIGGVSPVKNTYPTHTIVTVDSKTYVITIQFFDSKTDGNYSQMRRAQIDDILDSIRIYR